MPNRKQNRAKENKVGRQSVGGGTKFPWFVQLFFPGEAFQVFKAPARTFKYLGLSVSLSVYQSVYLSVCWSVGLSVGLSVLQKLQKKITELYKTFQNVTKH